MLKSVIFDFDGVIVDSEPFHYQAFQEVLAPLGLSFTWDEYLTTYIGFDDRDAFREAHRQAGLPLSEDELQQLIQRKAVLFPTIAAKTATPYPGVIELITDLAARIPLALCSGALRSDITPITERFGISECFSVVVTADDVHVSKPDPASYRLALKLLQQRFPAAAISPTDCLAIEDTPAGIASASGAGLRVVAVTNSYPADQLTAASRIVASLAGLSYAHLATI